MYIIQMMVGEVREIVAHLDRPGGVRLPKGGPPFRLLFSLLCSSSSSPPSPPPSRSAPPPSAAFPLAFCI